MGYFTLARLGAQHGFQADPEPSPIVNPIMLHRNDTDCQNNPKPALKI